MDIMQAILDIENKAKEIVESADEANEKQQEKFRDEIKKMHADTDEKIRDEIASLQKTFVSEQTEALENIESEYQKKMEKLENICSLKLKTWVSDITADITGRQ